MKTRKKSNKTTTIFNLRTDVKCQFKAYCAERGKTMVQVLEEIILERIRRDRK